MLNLRRDITATSFNELQVNSSVYISIGSVILCFSSDVWRPAVAVWVMSRPAGFSIHQVGRKGSKVTDWGEGVVWTLTPLTFGFHVCKWGQGGINNLAHFKQVYAHNSRGIIGFMWSKHFAHFKVRRFLFAIFPQISMDSYKKATWN